MKKDDLKRWGAVAGDLFRDRAIRPAFPALIIALGVAIAWCRAREAKADALLRHTIVAHSEAGWLPIPGEDYEAIIDRCCKEYIHFFWLEAGLWAALLGTAAAFVVELIRHSIPEIRRKLSAGNADGEAAVAPASEAAPAPEATAQAVVVPIDPSRN